MKFNFKLDPWQEEFLKAEGDIIVKSGRQVGKSVSCAIKAGEYAVKNPKKAVMIVSATERQAYLLFSKVLGYLLDNYKNYIKGGLNRPTKTKIVLRNESIIYCLPTGIDGSGIRGYTIDMLIVDESAHVPDIWSAVTPMLATTGGNMILLSTPFGKEGYFYEAWISGKFKKFQVSTEQVAMNRPEPMRTRMLENLEREKKRMPALQYAQEYMGEFIDELRRLIPDELILKRCILKRRGATAPGRRYYLGVDVGGMGDDASTFQVVDMTKKESIKHVENLSTTKQYITETTDKVLALEKTYKFRQIYVDDAGLGFGLFSNLLSSNLTKNKVIPLNNLSRPLDKDERRKKKILKEDLYMNFLTLLEQGHLHLLDDEDVVSSLRSVQVEYTMEQGKRTKTKIYSSPHSESHIIEGLVRACWGAQDKRLNIWVR